MSGLIESAQHMLAGVLELGRTRFELFGAELREELGRLAATVLGGLSYSYFVRAFDASGRASGPSQSARVDVPLPDYVRRRAGVEA